MPVLWSPESAYSQELAKWEARPTAYVPEPGRPFVFREYPKMLVKASRATGGPKITDTITAANPSEEATLLSRGWSLTQEAAIEAIHAQDRDIAQAAAERAFSDRRMSERAQAEARAADDATPAHVPVVPETPIRKRRPYVRKAKETS